MRNEEAMLNDLASKAAVSVIGAAILIPAFPPALAEEGQPAVRSRMLVSTAWLEKHLDDAHLVILQIGQDRAQFDAGHIPGSRFVRLDELVEQRPDSLNELPSLADLKEAFESVGVGDESRVVLADNTGGVLAARAYFTLDYLGHGDQVALLDGGLRTWAREARTVSKQEPAIVRQEFTPRVSPEVLVTTAQMERLSLEVSKGDLEYALLDARPAAEYSGLVQSESVSQAGHIAGSTSLHWKSLIRTEADPKLLDTDNLRRQFEGARVKPGQTVVTYCRTGMQSSFTYFVAKYLGYRAAMYDGSVYEWVRTSGNRLVRSPESDHPVSVHQQKFTR